MDKIINKAKQALSGHPVLFWVAKVIFGPITRYNERQIIARKQQVFQKNALFFCVNLERNEEYDMKKTDIRTHLCTTYPKYWVRY